MNECSEEDRRLFEAAVEQFSQRGGAAAVREKLSADSPGAGASRTGRRRRRQASQAPRADRTVDLHGQTVEEAMATLDSALSAAPRGEWLRVVHGHGTGALARACLHRLRNDSRVLQLQQPPVGSDRAELLVRLR